MSKIQIGRVRKEYKKGTHRSVDPKKTLENIKPVIQDIGVADFFEMTEIDRINIPAYCSVRPKAAWGGTKVTAGTAISSDEAKVSALMGAVERYSAEYRGESMEFSSYEQLGLTQALDPKELILPREMEIGEQTHWVLAWDLLGENEIYVPANAVFHPYDPLGMAQQLFRSDSNGLAAGNTIEEAVLHAIYEVIEKDALSCAEKNRSLGRRLVIDTQGPLFDLYKKFEENGIDIRLWYIDGKTGVHTVAAAADDTETKDPQMLVTGSGSNLCPETAAIHALTEVAQRRCRNIRSDSENKSRIAIVEKAGYDRLKRINKIWFEETAAEIKISQLPDRSTDYFDEDIKIVLEDLLEHTDSVFVYDLSKTKIPVVRVVIPGFEVSYTDSSRRKK
ncbi:MAG: YcaO-related McrA-glycine thioamidation protein [Methanomicrobium sp.]|nr:YcaO-related McrA-glycine thioamidation protein [Methanomicrobium sp.]